MAKVYCLYCGSEMEIEWDDFDFCAYTCPRCNSKAPRGDNIEDAEEKALQGPPQKPLTLEEAKKELALWFEYPPNIYNHRARLYPELYSSDYRAESQYGIGWRCWATKPTDEERRAAKWE